MRVFSGDAAAQADLIAARCMDERQVARAGNIPGADLVDIAVKPTGAASQQAAELPEVLLSDETERAFAWLRRQCPLNPDFEQHLIGYARLTGLK